MTNNKQINRIRGKSLKIITTEQEMIEFANICATYTAYMLDIKTHQEMPSIETLNSAAIPYKTFIAKKIAMSLGRHVDPKSIRSATLETIMIGGYFRVQCSLWETSSKGKDSVTSIQSFKLTFMDDTNLPLVTKLSQVLSTKHPDMTAEEIIHSTAHLF